MKHIIKQPPPSELIAWAAANAGLPSLQYGAGGFPQLAVHRALVGEQGYLCAYTMRQIVIDDSHVEHLKPQSVSRDEGNPAETASFGNIVACFPKRQAGGQKITFGAIFREDAWDSVLFLMPTNPACETRIRFLTNGKVQPARADDEAAIWTIKNLGLASPILDDWRKNAIEDRGLSLTADRPASRREAESIIADICSRKQDGRFQPYCVAIKHAAEAYLKLLDKQAKKAKYAARAQKRGKK